MDEIARKIENDEYIGVEVDVDDQVVLLYNEYDGRYEDELDQLNEAGWFILELY